MKKTRCAAESGEALLLVLSRVVGARSGESGAHVLRVAAVTRVLLDALAARDAQAARRAGARDTLCLAAALHDIGKIAVPAEILSKPGRLTCGEFEIVKGHTLCGARLLDGLDGDGALIPTARAICRWHHERWDGGGYPDGLRGDEIPLAAQLAALADVYDALTSARPYKAAYAPERARAMIARGECGAFSPRLLACLAAGAEELERLPAPA